MLRLRCGACSSVLGVTTAATPPRVFCNEYCASDTPVTNNELRDDIIMELHRRGYSSLQIALRVDLTRARVHQIVLERT